MSTADAAGIALGTVADALFGDPQRHHPVAIFGSWVARCEEAMYADSVARGAVFTAVTLAPAAALGVGAHVASRNRPLLRTGLMALATWAVLGSRSLAHEGAQMADELEADDLSAARDRLTHLCSRDPSGLDTEELARGAFESLAENTSDAAVCSLFWGAVAGIPGLLLHRGINTLDAMVGYRNDRYEKFGKVSARLDDVAAFIPARLTGLISCATAPLAAGSAADAWRVMRRDATKHPSPNGGYCEAAWAGAFGVKIGGASTYHGRVEDRPVLGDDDAPGPTPAKLRQASRLVGWVTAASAGIAALARVRLGS